MYLPATLPKLAGWLQMAQKKPMLPNEWILLGLSESGGSFGSVGNQVLIHISISSPDEIKKTPFPRYLQS